MWKCWRRFGIFFLASLVVCFVFHAWSEGQAEPSIAPPETQLLSSPSQNQLVQQGIERYQAGKFTEAIALWQQALPQISAAKDRAVIYTNLALAYRQTGQLAGAIAQWEQAIQIYRAQNEAMRQPLAGLLIEQAQAYTDLGQQRVAIPLLQSAIQIALQNQDRLTEAAAQGALGNAQSALGEYEQALKAQKNSLKIAQELNNATYIATALNDLGNVYVGRGARYSYQAMLADLEGDDQQAARLVQIAEQDKAKARQSFEQSAQTARGVAGFEEVRGLMNLNRLLEQGTEERGQQTGKDSSSSLIANRPSPIINPSDQDLMVRNWNRVGELLTSAPNSRDKAYALINLAQQELRAGKKVGNPNLQPSILLEQALAVARTIGDARAESFAVGSLGQLHEAAGDYDKAMELTRTAQFAAQQINASDSLYRWQWQAGRILKATGAKQQAIAAYEQAIATLQSIRGDIVAANQELQFDFREQVEPVYRELMELLLDSSASGVKSQPSKGEASPVSRVVDILELLKLAELQNFFGDECVQVALAKGEGKAGLSDTNTAVVYSVILDDQTEMILRSPDGSMAHFPVPMGRQEIQAEIDQLRYFLELRPTEEYLPQAQKVYNLLIRPMEADLAAAKPSTLIFINDGVLRKVPMAALHDGKEFLVQKYPIAITPSLSLTNAKPLDHSNLEALSLGLTVERAPFAALTNVKAEVRAVNDILGGTELLDKAFTLSNLRSQLQKKSYPIVHMATHGKFGVDAETTFLVGYDQRISIEQIDNLLRSRGGKQPVELLTLSACQTAAGDNRSALGIAGVAVRAGVESALATLWYINDEATVPLIKEFYRQLRQPNITKAQALRNAQMKMISQINYNHPAVWSPFILIGNWL
jgi:CHAT domain-containing protein